MFMETYIVALASDTKMVCVSATKGLCKPDNTPLVLISMCGASQTRREWAVVTPPDADAKTAKGIRPSIGRTSRNTMPRSVRHRGRRKRRRAGGRLVAASCQIMVTEKNITAVLAFV